MPITGIAQVKRCMICTHSETFVKSLSRAKTIASADIIAITAVRPLFTEILITMLVLGVAIILIAPLNAPGIEELVPIFLQGYLETLTTMKPIPTFIMIGT